MTNQMNPKLKQVSLLLLIGAALWYMNQKEAVPEVPPEILPEPPPPEWSFTVTGGH